MTANTTSARRAEPAAILYGAAANIAALTQASGNNSWRGTRAVGVICPDGYTGPLPLLGRAIGPEAIAAAGERVADIIFCESLTDRTAPRAFLRAVTELGLRPLIASLNEDRASVRPMSIADLLAGAPSAMDWAHARAALVGKRILVTGAGGSIGSELCRQLVGLWPARLILLDSSEFNLYSIDHELAQHAPNVPRVRALCDIRDGEAVARLFKRERPDIVLHVAALKHVPMVEEFVGEGVLTNVLGTRNVADAALALGADMMLVSTDKAVEPVSMMGATKRAAEIVCQTFDRRSARQRGPRFIVARLGNVLGSAGSVTPVFDRQIAAGGPVTVTHPDVARFFISIPQAAGFLLQALVAGLEPHAPRGVALVLDMGEPIRVVDLARDMIRLHGLRPDHDIAVKFVGLRPGEKLIEQLIDETETLEPPPGPSIMAASGATYDLPVVRAEIDRLVVLARAGHDELVRERLRLLVRAPQADALAAIAV